MLCNHALMRVLSILTIIFISYLPSHAGSIVCLSGEEGEGTMIEFEYDAVGNIVRQDIYKPPIANFTFAPASGDFFIALRDVAFTDLSTGNPSPDTWSWDFGDIDRNSSSEQNPLHPFTTEGNYTITLDISNPCGSDQTTKDIEVLPCPNRKVRVEGINPGIHDSLFDAYNAAGDGDIIRSQAVHFTNNLIIAKNLTIEGGYNCDFIPIISGYTTIHGSLTVDSGTFTVNASNLVLD